MIIYNIINIYFKSNFKKELNIKKFSFKNINIIITLKNIDNYKYF